MWAVFGNGVLHLGSDPPSRCRHTGAVVYYALVTFRIAYRGGRIFAAGLTREIPADCPQIYESPVAYLDEADQPLAS
jgi:hypothetical protein